MYQKLKLEIKVIIEIVNQCPESLQEKCFEVLLNNYLSSITQKPDKGKSKSPQEAVIVNDVPGDFATSDKSNSSESIVPTEITINDFHVKVRRFLDLNDISIDTINFLYYKDEGKILPLYESLGSTKMSECQIRLALLTAFENSFNDGSGEMLFNGEVIRQRCQDMKCYDVSNFTSNFKKNSEFFDNWPERYDKDYNCPLTSEGKKELAEVLLELGKNE